MSNEVLRSPRTSVIMATYNGARFLAEQLARSIRCIGSLPTRIRRNAERLGYGEDFLTACSLATGEPIAFCDQDDIWRPEKLQVAKEALAGSDASLFIHTAEVIDEAGRLGRFDQGTDGRVARRTRKRR